jgi:hypothetical protein
LLIVLTGSYLLSAFAAGRWIDALIVILFATATLLALRNSLVPPRMARLILTAMLAASAIMLAVTLTTASRTIPGDGCCRAGPPHWRRCRWRCSPSVSFPLGSRRFRDRMPRLLTGRFSPPPLPVTGPNAGLRAVLGPEQDICVVLGYEQEIQDEKGDKC